MNKPSERITEVADNYMRGEQLSADRLVYLKIQEVAKILDDLYVDIEKLKLDLSGDKLGRIERSIADLERKQGISSTGH